MDTRTMGNDIGRQLREARERQGLTLRQVADSTKLSTTTLQYIEQNRFDLLPGGIYAKGFLRAYAAEVGLNPEEVVHQYAAQFLAAHASEPLPHAPALVIGRPNEGRRLAIAVIALVCALVVFTWFQDFALAPTPGPMELAPGLSSDDSPGIEEVVPDVVPATERLERGIRLEIRPTGRCWVSAVADGQLVVHGMLQNGERVIVRADDELVLRVGDPETFVYTLNGALGRRLGEARQPVTVRITGDSYLTFLVDRAPPAPGDASASVM